MFPRQIESKLLMRAALGLMLLGVTGSLQAQSTSAPVGYYKLGAYDGSGNYLGLLSNSDTLISVPFTRPPEFVGTVQSVAGNIVTVTGAPGWTTGQFVYGTTQPKTYYALMGPSASGPANPKEGCLYTVTANTANTLTLDLNGDTIASLPANATLTLLPYWTLATLFPAANANISFTPTASTRTFKTEVLIPNYAQAGINLAYAATYYFIDSGTNIGWRLFGDATTTDHSNDILIPNGYFVVRNSNSAPTLPLALVGNVLPGKLATPLASLSTSAQDNAVAVVRPLDITLNESGLVPTDGSFVATTSTRSFKDQLLLYNNVQVALNKSPSATYYYMNNAWRLFGDATTVDHGTDLIPAGSALTIRKASASSPSTVYWLNAPTY